MRNKETFGEHERAPSRIKIITKKVCSIDFEKHGEEAVVYSL